MSSVALTPGQRLHLEVNGYVVVEHTLTAVETSAIFDKIHEIEEDFHANGPIRAAGKQGLPAWTGGGEGWEPRSPRHFYTGQTRQFFRVDNLPHLAPCFLDYVTHPRLVGMANEAVGGEVRLEQSDAHIVRSSPNQNPAPGYGFHRGGIPGMGYELNGLFHYPFVKTLTNLTDLGPDDGGTTVIAGTHKLNDELRADFIRAALDDPHRPLIHSVEAPAGSTLLFFESLVHSGGINRSGRDRVLIVGGYTPPMYQAWEGYDPHPDLAESVSDETRALLFGTTGWMWRPRPGAGLRHSDET